MEQLMERYQRGDATAFHALYGAVSSRLYRYLSMIPAGGAGADDLLQQTWLEVHRARATYDARRPFLPWLFAVARNMRRHSLRGNERLRRREAYAVVGAELQTSGAAPEDLLTVRRALDALPSAQREVVVLLKYAQLSIDEAAAVLSTSPGAVKQRAHRGYEKLRELLGPDDGQQPESVSLEAVTGAVKGV